MKELDSVLTKLVFEVGHVKQKYLWKMLMAWVWIDDVISIFIKSKKSYLGKGTILRGKDRVWYNTSSVIYGEKISMTKWVSTCQVIVKFGHIFNIGDWLEKFLNKIGLVMGLLGRVEKRLGKGKRKRLLPESCCLRLDTTTRIDRGVVDIRLTR